MLQNAEALLGPYVWGRYDVLVLPATFPFGGMENPCLTFATPSLIVGDRSLVAVIAHEITHSWMGNLVTTANWQHFWHVPRGLRANHIVNNIRYFTQAQRRQHRIRRA